MGRLKGTLPLNIAAGSAVIEPGSIITQDLADGCVTIDKMRDKKCLFPVVMQMETPMVGTQVWGVVAPFDMELIEVSLHLQNTGTVGQTEVDVNVNGASIFPSGPLALVYNGGNYKTMDLKNNPIVFANNSEISIDIDDIATSCKNLTVMLTFKVNLTS